MDYGDHEDYIPGAFESAIDTLTRAKNIVEGVITDVDPVAFTCSVTIGAFNGNSGAQFLNVPLMVLTGSAASVVQLPQMNSQCLLVFRDGNIQRPQLYAVDQCDKFLITIGGSTLEVNSSLFKFNGGSNGGMVLVQALVTQLNNLQNAYNNHTHILTLSSGTGTAAPTVSTVTPTTRGDIENTSITQ